MSGIKELSFAEQSWLFAVLSKICYSDPAQAQPQFEEIGYTKVTFLDNSGSQGYVLENKNEIIVVCRGTETKEPIDMIQDIKLWYVSEPRVGLVHDGFKTSADLLWPTVYDQIQNHKSKPVYFTGHSLGAAMASVMAVRMLHDSDMAKPKKLFTYGSPRAFSFISSCIACSGIEHHRWVNNLDIVTRSPGMLMGYRHFGKLHYINSWGNVVDKANVFYRERDRIGSWNRAIADSKLGYIDSHGIDHYISALENYKNGIVSPERTDFKWGSLGNV